MHEFMQIGASLCGSAQDYADLRDIKGKCAILREFARDYTNLCKITILTRTEDAVE